MKIGGVYPQIEAGGDPAAVRSFATAMEEMGIDHLLVFDHVVGASHDREPVLTGPYDEEDPFHDPFTMFAYLAGLTQRIEFVTGILILPQRQTVLVAKQATDVFLLCGGRFRMGVGTGWNYVEYDALGQDFHSRGARLDEQIPYLRRLWSELLLTFEGRFDRIDRANLNPRPPGPIPIWVGGFSEPAYRRGGRLGDGFIFAGTFDQARDGWGRVRHHLTEAGRTEDNFGRDFIALQQPGVDETADALKRWRDLGGTHGSIYTIRKGFTSIAQHIDFVDEVRSRLH